MSEVRFLGVELSNLIIVDVCFLMLYFDQSIHLSKGVGGAGTVVQLTELFSGGDKLSAVQINLRAAAVTGGGHGGLIDTVICMEKQRSCDDMLRVLFTAAAGCDQILQFSCKELAYLIPKGFF